MGTTSSRTACGEDENLVNGAVKIFGRLNLKSAQLNHNLRELFSLDKKTGWWKRLPEDDVYYFWSWYKILQTLAVTKYKKWQCNNLSTQVAWFQKMFLVTHESEIWLNEWQCRIFHSELTLSGENRILSGMETTASIKPINYIFWKAVAPVYFTISWSRV